MVILAFPPQTERECNQTKRKVKRKEKAEKNEKPEFFSLSHSFGVASLPPSKIELEITKKNKMNSNKLN